MNIAQVLTEAARAELVVPEGTLEFPDMANLYAGRRTARNTLKSYANMPEMYEYAAWLCIDNIRIGLEDAGIADTKQAQEKYLDPGGPAVAGIGTMARYLALLPYVYAKQRSNFFGMPETIDGQVDDLGSIARRSVDHIEVIAHQNIGVSGVLERNGYLRTGRSQSRRAESDDANHAYVLGATDEGLNISGRFDINFQTTLLERNWQHDHPNVKMRKVGCVMLHLTDPATGLNVFNVMWHSLVQLATSDPRYYKHDLQAIAQMQKDYDY